MFAWTLGMAGLGEARPRPVLIVDDDVDLLSAERQVLAGCRFNSREIRDPSGCVLGGSLIPAVEQPFVSPAKKLRSGAHLVGLLPS